MPIYQRGDAWLVSVGSKDNRFRKSFKNYADAVLAEKRQLLIMEGVIEAPTPAQVKAAIAETKLERTLEDAYKVTLKDIWSQRKTKGQPRLARYVMDSLGWKTPIKDITTSLIRELVDELEEDGNEGSTVNGKLSALSMMLKTAADEGWIESLPRIKRRKPGDHRIRWMDYEEEMEALNTCTKLGFQHLRDFIIVGVDTGFRRMELIGFKPKEYRNGMLHLHGDQTKTSKARAVPATSRVDEIITRRKGNELLFDPLTNNTVWDQWSKLREAMGKKDDSQFVIHMLRHTCASRLAMQDKSAQFIQAWMGHATPITTARYMHLAPGKLKEGIEALDNYRKQNAPMLKSA